MHTSTLRPSTNPIMEFTCVTQTMELAGMRDRTPCWYKVMNKYERKAQTIECYFLSVFNFYFHPLSEFMFLFLSPLLSFCMAPDCLIFFSFFLTVSSSISLNLSIHPLLTPLTLLSVHLLRPGGFQTYVPPFLYLYLTISFSFFISPSHFFTFFLSSSVHYPSL